MYYCKHIMYLPKDVADALKLILKEYVSPTQANFILFFLGPIITLIFSLFGYAVIPYGPGLAISDYNLGILYMLAVSSLSTYGILLAGWVRFHKPMRLSHFTYLTYYHLFFLVIRCIIFFFCLLFFFLAPFCNLQFVKEISLLSFGGSEAEINNLEYMLSNSVIISHKVKANFKVKNTHIRRVQTTKSLKSTNSPDLSQSNAIKYLHSSFIKELYKDRKAPVIHFKTPQIGGGGVGNLFWLLVIIA